MLNATGELIGAVGYVPLLAPFEQITELRPTPTESHTFTPEFGLSLRTALAASRRACESLNCVIWREHRVQRDPDLFET